MPNETESESSLSVHEICSLHTDDMHVVLSCEVETVVGVFDSLEAREGKRGFSDSTPNDRSRVDFVEGLKEYETIL